MQLFSSAPIGVYSAPIDIPGGSCCDKVDLTKCSVNVIYEMYDKLAEEYPQFVTKSVMGEVFSLGFNRYTFQNYKFDNTSSFDFKPIKICIVASLHGYEQGSAWTTAQFFKLLCENKYDPHLSFLRRNVVFDVIPVANPWGFENNQRKNGNQVDLNRNFEPDFVDGKKITSSVYGGPYPCSETETQLLMKFIDENKDASVVLDYHNIAEGYPLFYVYGQKDVQLAYGVFAELTDKWQREYPEFPRDRILGRVKPNGHHGMFADYLLEKKLWVLTMETPWCMPVVGKTQYDEHTIRCAVDVLANTLLAVASYA